MKILAVSDVEIGFIYSPMISQRFSDIDLVISCGDLPYYYLEYILSTLNVPLYYVRGNHASRVEFGSFGERTHPWGAVDLHRRVVEDDTGLLLAGMEGCLMYNQGRYQYTQHEMWLNVLLMTPRLMLNKIRFGRYLDVFISHAPPWKINDMDDLPHQGFKAYRWLLKVFKPAIHLHGHIHLYRQDIPRVTSIDESDVVNVYGYYVLNLPTPLKRSWQKESLKPTEVK